MKLQFIRNASLILELDNKKILVDPVFSEKFSLDPIPFSNDMRNPISDLADGFHTYLKNIDAVFITHFHEDHFDSVAIENIDKDLPIYCQKHDFDNIQNLWFKNIFSIDETISIENITVQRFLASHFHGDTQTPPFGHSSSYFFQTQDKKIFITWDAILDEKLTKALESTQPEIIIANLWDCQFSQENPILSPGKNMTLTNKEILEIQKNYPSAKIIAIHLDGVNHATVSREDFIKYVTDNGIQNNFIIPKNGELIEL